MYLQMYSIGLIFCPIHVTTRMDDDSDYSCINAIDLYRYGSQLVKCEFVQRSSHIFATDCATFLWPNINPFPRNHGGIHTLQWRRMGIMTSQITDNSIICSPACSQWWSVQNWYGLLPNNSKSHRTSSSLMMILTESYSSKTHLSSLLSDTCLGLWTKG